MAPTASSPATVATGAMRQAQALPCPRSSRQRSKARTRAALPGLVGDREQDVALEADPVAADAAGVLAREQSFQRTPERGVIGRTRAGCKITVARRLQEVD